ncbi:MAG: helix-turn-helix transcriptional regulator [Alphaproteobacteria bacterium]
MQLTDLRGVRSVPLLTAGARALIDQDVVTPEEASRAEFYHELRSQGLAWFAGVTAWSGSAPWVLAIQRTLHQGLFDPEDKRPLELLSPRLSEAATLSRAVGLVALSSAGGALNAMHHAAVAIGRRGTVLDANPAAHAMFDRYIYVNDGRLHFADPRAGARLDQAIAAIRAAADAQPLGIDPIVIARGDEPPVLARVLSIPAAARNPFLGARALLALTPMEARRGPNAAALQRVFGLTAAEARLASLLAEGTTLDEAREVLGVGRETARTQLKAVFGKTGVHRQGALVALLASLPI